MFNDVLIRIDIRQNYIKCILKHIYSSGMVWTKLIEFEEEKTRIVNFDIVWSYDQWDINLIYTFVRVQEVRQKQSRESWFELHLVHCCGGDTRFVFSFDLSFNSAIFRSFQGKFKSDKNVWLIVQMKKSYKIPFKFYSDIDL